MYDNGNTKSVSSCVLTAFNGVVLLALYYIMVIVLFGAIASPDKDSLSNHNTRHYITILICLDDSTGQNSEFCIASENFVSQNPDVLEKN